MLTDPYHSDSSYNGDSSDDDGSSVSGTATEEIVPCDADVLLGRGTKHHLHPGNMRYNGTRRRITNVMMNNEVLSLTHSRLLVAVLLDLNRDRYNGCTNSIAKRAIIREIVGSILSNNGRFLKQAINNTNKTEQWVVISTAKAHLKAAHAIQYRMRKMAGTRRIMTDSSDGLEHGRTDTFLSSSAEHVFGACQQSTKCCDKCQKLESNIAWILLAQHQVNDLQPLGDRCSKDSGRGINVFNIDPLQESRSDQAQPRTDTPYGEDDPVDNLLTQLSESFAALEPLDLSMVPSCPDDSAAAMASLMESANIDPAWLWSSLDVYA
jgi:hypothetical protein